VANSHSSNLPVANRQSLPFNSPVAIRYSLPFSLVGQFAG
jgi:hypothetical protein